MTRLFRKQFFIAILPVLVLAAFSTFWITQLAEQRMIAQLEEQLAVENELQAASVRAFLDVRIAELEALAATAAADARDQPKILAHLTRQEKRLAQLYEGLYFNDL